MKESEAADILHDLAVGKSPLTGNSLYDIDDIFDPRIVSAIALGALALKEKSEPGTKKEKKNKSTSKPAGAGRRWSTKEENELALHFHSEMQIKEIAKAHDRTTGAIRSRLQKMELIDEYGNPLEEPEAEPVVIANA